MDGLWHGLSSETLKMAPQHLWGWICLDQSMTAAVSRVAGGAVTVEVKRQEDGPLAPDEMRFFPEGQPATLREVCLSSPDCPLLVARTVFTSDVLRSHPAIVKLGTKPLGSLLFDGGVACRHTVREFARITPQSPLYDLIRWRHHGENAEYWGRRTLFWLFGAPMLVTELMLPELVNSPFASQALTDTMAQR